MIDVTALTKLYQTYGYRSVSTSPQVLTFLYEQGRYFGADIIPLDSEQETRDKCDVIREEYSHSGFATQIRDYKSLEDAEREMYRSFFSYLPTRHRIANRFAEFTKAQSRLNGGHKYDYIHSPYLINNETGSGHIIEIINGILSQGRPQLLVVEAPAGYGKTCTAFEILKTLAECSFCENPLMTELSRNRGANIFKYILLDEIDREYPHLDSSLVKYEIRTGRIPLIIDGFDELLNKSDIVKTDRNELFGEVETMLDTIGGLLKGKAKIVLTTRKTAIFGGEDFQKWLLKWDNEFDCTRIAIEIPRIKDWINAERFKAIKEHQVPVESIANPVLLTFLRNLTDAEFSDHLQTPDSIVKKYFHSLHEREMKRQELKISPDDQYAIFKSLAKMMVEFDQTSERRAFIREMIIDQNKSILEKALTLYSSEMTLDLIADKLVNHALLDRKPAGEDQIGFINDFVFGTFLGEIMSESPVDEIDSNFSANMVELGATAYRVQDLGNKAALWEKIEALSDRFEMHTLFNFDITLKGELRRHYRDTIFRGVQAFRINFTPQHSVINSVFISCRFKNCSFERDSLAAISFIECHFEDCSVDGHAYLEDIGEIYAIKCTQRGEHDVLYVPNYSRDSVQPPAERMIEDDFLLKLYNIEQEHKSQRIVQIMRKYPRADYKSITKAINNLHQQKILRISGLDVFIELNKVVEVKKRIGIK